jgi:general secretion pathway protein F
MPTYRYRAIAEQGTVVEGVAAAPSPRALTDELLRKGMMPATIRRSFLLPPARIADDELLLFLGEFSALVRSGVAIPEALTVMAEYAGRSPLRAVLADIRMEVLKGAALSEALAAHPRIFSTLLIALIRVGEKSGEIIAALTHCQSLTERSVALRRKVRQALVYPVFVLLMLAAIVTVLLFFSMPRFIEIYADLGAELPGPTRMLMTGAEWVGRYGWLALPGLAALFLGWRNWKPTARWRLAWERAMGNLPLLGRLREAYNLSLCCHVLHSLTESGMTIVDALRHASRSLPGITVPRALAGASERILHGEGLVQALRAQRLLPPAAMKLLEAGEKSGTVPKQLQELARHFDRLFEYRLATVVSLIEPMLVLVTGILVGAAVIAMYLPIFGMAGVLG